MRPSVRFLSDQLIETIVAEARDLLRTLGVEIHNPGVLSLLSDHGARVDAGSSRAFFTDDMIDKALGTAPSGFRLYDQSGIETHDLSGHNVHFTPGSAAINVLEHGSQSVRTPTTADYVAYVKVVTQLAHLPSQSTALVPADVHANISWSRARSRSMPST
jgi:trimethylamine--corrinoid protein Co-methyltransferase